MRPIDLRSDTVTHPTPAMRRAMAEAELGDDVFGDDPTVNALEERAAELLGKEAGLFVSSGSQGNLVSLMAHLGRGQEAIAAFESHVVSDEAAGHAVVVGASVRTLHSAPDGTMDLAEIAESFRDPTDPHEPITGLVTLENTHAHSGARPLSVAYTAAVAGIAHDHGVPLHVDGARFWNAVVALGADPKDARGPGGQRHVLPLQGPRVPRSARSWWGAATSSGAPVARASSSAAGCGRSASSPPPASSPSRTAPTGPSPASPTTT